MPYKDPDRKAEWDRTHRPERQALAAAATAYADRQIRILKASGVTHAPAEWAELRSALRVGFRVLPTDRDVRAGPTDPPISPPTAEP